MTDLDIDAAIWHLKGTAEDFDLARRLIRRILAASAQPIPSEGAAQRDVEPPVIALLSRALEAVELLQKIRCHPRRHDLDRHWLTEADVVIGYWEKTRTAAAIRAVIAEKGSHE